MTPEQSTHIEKFRRCVTDMMHERDSGVSYAMHKPSRFWSNCNRFLSYIRDLPVHHLENIRAHIGMGFFIGNPWDKDFFDGHRLKDESQMREHPVIKKYLSYTKNLPRNYHCGEPRTNDLIEQIGILYNGKIINHDLVKEQACISNLYQLGVLEPLRERPGTILELGPGYGQLALQLSNCLHPNGRFICIDHPETLFWSSTFLAVNSDPELIYMYHPEDSINLSKLLKKYRIILIPTYRSELIRQLNGIDLIINQNSLAEMSEDQVRYYLSLFSEVLTGWIYSYNANRQFMNAELVYLLIDLFSEYFEGVPPRDYYNHFYGGDWSNTDQKYIFFGQRKDNGRDDRRRSMVDTQVWISGRQASFKRPERVF